MPYFDRLDYVSPMVQEHAFVLAAEHLLSLEIPERALWIRVLFDEITRILNHALQIGAQGLDLGATTPFLWLLRKEKSLCLFMRQFQEQGCMQLIIELVVCIKIFLSKP